MPINELHVANICDSQFMAGLTKKDTWKVGGMLVADPTSKQDIKILRVKSGAHGTKCGPGITVRGAADLGPLSPRKIPAADALPVPFFSAAFLADGARHKPCRSKSRKHGDPFICRASAVFTRHYMTKRQKLSAICATSGFVDTQTHSAVL